MEKEKIFIMEKIKSVLKKDSFYKDLIVTFGGQMIVMVLSFVLNKIISNQYSVSDYGVYSLLKRFSSVITFVMLMAMGIAIPKYVAEAKAQKDKVLMESYMVSGIVVISIIFVCITVVLSLFDNFWARLIFNDNEYGKFMLIICLYSYGNCLVTYAYSFYRGINKFVKYSVINIILQFIFIVPTIFVKRNLWKLYLVWSVITIGYSILEILIIYKENKFSIKNLKRKLFTLKELIQYSVPRVPGEFILFAYSLIPLTIVSYKFGTEQVGYFSAALSINSLVTPVFSLVGTILLPLVSGSKFNKKEKEVNQKIKILAYIYTAVSILAIVFVYVFGENLLIILFNKEYIKSIDIVRIMIISIVPNAYYLLLRNPLDGKSKFPYNTICLLVSFVIYVVLLLFASNIKMCAVDTIIAYTVLGALTLGSWIKVTIYDAQSISH